MSNVTYKRAPIVEAVIEVRFSAEMKESAFIRLVKKFKQNYENSKPADTFGFEVKLQGGEPRTDTTVIPGYHFSSQDQSKALVLKKSTFTVSQLAPYEGWEAFISRFERDWCAFKKYSGIRDVDRIGVRYINRLDIPNSEGLVYEEEYLNIYPTHPEALGPFVSYAVQSKVELIDIGAILQINSAVVPSPLAKHVSIVIDQDIVKTQDFPSSTEDTIEYLNQVREKKNFVFESCITDKARELFD